MFLVLTADQRFWKTDGKILFLGEWCRLYREKSIWSNLDAEILPFHWDDREKFRQDYGYANELHEKYLIQFTRELNQLHGVNYSIRYWRTIIGPWLNFFIGVFYDRFLSIDQVAKSNQVSLTWIPSLYPDQHIPKDFSSCRECFFWDFFVVCGEFFFVLDLDSDLFLVSDFVL